CDAEKRYVPHLSAGDPAHFCPTGSVRPVALFGNPLDPTFTDDRLLPSQHATYQIFAGPNLIKTVTNVAQSLFPPAVHDAELGLAVKHVWSAHFSSGYIRVRLLESPVGYVAAGPLRIVSEGDGTVTRVMRHVDPGPATGSDLGFKISDTCSSVSVACEQTVDAGPNLEGPPDDPGDPLNFHKVQDDGWVQLGYDGGSGNFPLWESEVLRPVFRAYFRDWQNGPHQFPDLGDPTSHDPNTTPMAPSTFVHGSYATPFSPVPEDPAVPTPTPITIGATGVYSYTGTTYIDGIAAGSAVTINVSPVATAPGSTIKSSISQFVRTDGGDFAADGFSAGQEIV